MGREFGSQSNHVEIVEAVNRLAQTFVILIFNKELVECFIYRTQIVFLHRLEVLLRKLESPVPSASELTDYARVVDILLEHFHQTGEKRWMISQIVSDSLVHDFLVANLCNGIQEEIVLPRRSAIHHDLHCVIVLLVLHVQIDSRGEQTSAFASTNHFRYIEFAEKHLAVLHDFLRNMFSVKDTQLSEDTNVSILKPDSLLKQRHNVSEVSQV
mmetsp:Transcript_4218/g.7277  ORF Transcript_4218/g.7277 Transcript_4218/m.7277 type:complete len:213 (+) Transcript_4218:981-1619(+)